MKLKILGFDKKLVPLILKGEKTITWRLFGHHNRLMVNDIVFLENTQTREMFGKARITYIKDKTMKEISDGDKEGHEEFSNEKEMYKVYSGYYGCRVDENTPVRVIRFKIL